MPLPVGLTRRGGGGEGKAISVTISYLTASEVECVRESLHQCRVQGSNLHCASGFSFTLELQLALLRSTYVTRNLAAVK